MKRFVFQLRVSNSKVEICNFNFLIFLFLERKKSLRKIIDYAVKIILFSGDQKIGQFFFADYQIVQERGRIESPISARNRSVAGSVI